MLFTLAAAALLLAQSAPKPAPPVPRLTDAATDRVMAFQAAIAVEQANEAEMARISRDFGTVYRLVDMLKDVTIQYKAPEMLRIASRNGVGLLIANGADVRYRLGVIEKRESGTPLHKRHSLLDLGILTRAGLAESTSTYVRTETVDGTHTQVFRLRFGGSEGPRYVVWVDTARHVVLKREWRDEADRARAVFRALDVKELEPGIWVPTRIEVRNGAGRLACVTRYSDARVNLDLSDDLFDPS